MNKKFIAALISASVTGMLATGAASAKTLSVDAQELIEAAAFAKYEVEQCVFDQGVDDIDRCSSGNKASDFSSESGWDLNERIKNLAPKFIESIDVKNGVITAKAHNSGSHGKTVVVMPKFEKDEDGEYIGFDWVAYEDMTQRNPESILVRASRYIAENYKLFRKMNLSIDVPAAENFASDSDVTEELTDLLEFAFSISNIHKFGWADSKIIYENKFGDSKSTSGAFAFSLPALKAFAKDEKTLFSADGVKVFLSIDCSEKGICTANHESSVKNANDGRLNYTDVSWTFALENMDLASYMKKVCGNDNKDFDLISLDELSECTRDDKNFSLLPVHIGANFKLKSGLAMKVDGKPFTAKLNLYFNGNKPLESFWDVFGRINAELFVVIDKEALSKLLGGDEKKIKFAKDNFDKVNADAGDSYKVELSCVSKECKVNGKSLDDIEFSDESSDEDSKIDVGTRNVKMQVELCIFDQGREYIERCATGKQASDFEGGRGWDLSKAAKEYESDEIESIEVKDGVITVKYKNTEMLKGATFIWVPKFDEDDQIEWVIDDKSTCKSAGVC